MKLLARALAVLVMVIGVSGGVFVPAEVARAEFDLMLIREVFPGTVEQPAAQYVELQMYAEDQNLVRGHDVGVFDAAGREVAFFGFGRNLGNGAEQAHILIATPEAETLLGVRADLRMRPVLNRAGGKVCWAIQVDCVSWGSFSADRNGTGTPFNAPTGLVLGQSMERKINAGSAADKLDAGDDTDDSAADFQLAAPSPTANAVPRSPDDPPQVVQHPRSVSVAVARRVAKGKVSVRDGFAQCGRQVPVVLQRRAGRAWRTVKTTRTDGGGRYQARLSRRGQYRATAPQVLRSGGHRCLSATSAVRALR